MSNDKRLIFSTDKRKRERIEVYTWTSGHVSIEELQRDRISGAITLSGCIFLEGEDAKNTARAILRELGTLT